MGSSPDINYPAQPSYGEGMAEALKAQAEFLKGTGDFRSVGSLESLLPLEESVRQKTAQMDTDILRTTLLGGDVTYNKDGKILEGYQDRSGRVIESEKAPLITIAGSGTSGSGYDSYKIKVYPAEMADQVFTENQYGQYQFADPSGEILEYDVLKDFPELKANIGDSEKEKAIYKKFLEVAESQNVLSKDQTSEIRKQIGEAKVGEYPPSFMTQSLYGGTDTVSSEMKVPAPKTVIPADATPIFRKDKDGNEIVKPQLANKTVSAGEGMVDLLGDTRDLTQYETRTATQADVNAGLADKVGDNFVQAIQTDDRAGFRDGNFKGLSVLAEDIQRGNLSRQREADLQDVSRLSGLYQGIMEDYKPGTASAMQGAKDLIEEQKDNLLADVGISDPAQVQSQGVQADPLRQNLMTQANEALGQGLTPREKKLIEESQRARATMMGRTFDQTAAIEEAKAQVLEDNQRKMQNRGFAQSVLGQEAGIQTADDTRRMGADQFNVGTKMDAERLRESLRQQGLLGYLDAASRISQIENQDQLDPFQAILGREGGTALQQGQQVFGQAGYGLNSGPQYLNPEAGLGFIQNQATNAANMYGAQQAAAANRSAGIFGGLGALGGGLLGNAGLFS